MMALETPSSAKEAAIGTGPPRWRRNIKFWKGEKVHDSQAENGARWLVDDASFEIASVATPSHCDPGSPQKTDNGSVEASHAHRPIGVSPSGTQIETERTRVVATAPKIPFILSEKEWTEFPTGKFDLDPRSFNGSEVSSLQKDGSTLQGSTVSIKSREKSVILWNTSYVVSDSGDAIAAYVAATQATQHGMMEDPSMLTIVAETLSPKVQLLHAVHMEPRQENRSVICANSCVSLQSCEPNLPYTTRNGIHQADEFTATLNSQAHTDQADELILDDDISSKESYHVAESVFDKLVYLLTCHPKMSLFSITQARDGVNYDDAEEGTFLEGGDTDGSSNSEDQTLSTCGYDGGHEADHEQTDDGSISFVTASLDSYGDGGDEDADEGTESENSRLKSRNHFSAEFPQGKAAPKPDDCSSSVSGSFMDQSHIYLTLTSARQERAMKSTNEIKKNGDFFIAWEERPKSTVSDSQTIARIMDTSPSSNEHPQLEANEETTSFAWLRQLQRQFYPTESHQLSIGTHDRWLRCIRQAVRNGSVDSLSILEERRAAAKEALSRMSLKSVDGKETGTERNILTFALWS